MNNKKKIVLGSIVGVIIGSLISVAYAVFILGNNSLNSQLVAGDIYMRYKENKSLTISDMIPSDTYNENDCFEFEIIGKNTSTNKNLVYNIVVEHGDDHETRDERILDKFLKFTLFEEKNGEYVKLVDAISYDDISDGQVIWQEVIKNNTTNEVNHRYKLYAWVSGVLVGNTSDADYDSNTWSSIFASIKVNVNSSYTNNIMRISNVNIMKKTNAEGSYVINNSMETTFTSTLNTPSSEVIYEVTIENNDTNVKKIERINVLNNSNNDITYEILNLDNNIVFAKTNKTFLVKVKYNIETLPNNVEDELNLIYIYSDFPNSINNPYKIQYIEDLVDLSKSVNEGITYENKYIKLERDLDFNDNNSYQDYTRLDYGDYNENETESNIKTELTTGIGWKSIGNDTNHFMGNFDGSEKTIANLYINNAATMGFFGYIENSIISNLSTSGSVNVDSSTPSAGIIVKAINSTINNCHNSTNVTVNYAGNSSAGIIGNVLDGTVTINNSCNSGTITGGNNLGGLVAYVNTNATLNINDSHNEGNLIQNKGQNAGGLVARSVDTSSTINISNSYNTGEVKMDFTTISNDKNLGGFVGQANGKINIKDSYNNGKVTFPNISGNSKVGGIIGITGGSSNVIIEDSFNLGEISGGWRVGGILGATYSRTIVNRCYNNGLVTSNLSDAATAGINGMVSSNANDYILNSYNFNDINGNGIIGGMYKGSVNVINSYNKGNVTGNGIISLNASRYNANINNVYNIGTLTESTKFGIAEINSYSSSGYTTTIKNAYYLNNVTNGTNNNNTYPTTKMTQNEMYSQNFVDTLNNNLSSINLASISEDIKDYELSTWKLGSGGYPVFDWQD